jgi:hypothetical protein
LAALQQSDEFRPEAMEALKLTAVHLKELELIDTLLDERYEKFRKMGRVFERQRADTLCHYPKLRRVRSIYARAAFRISSATLPSDFACLGLNHGK